MRTCAASMAGYMGGQVDAAGVKAAIKEGRRQGSGDQEGAQDPEDVRRAFRAPLFPKEGDNIDEMP